ncbi:thioesterase II family protein [Longimycelium tulufanense]|nr:alpha/beta fold hydrolase [Longimycelium tulufanense]
MRTTTRRAGRYVAFDERPYALYRLYCFPFAGGAASSYLSWRKFVPEHVELRVAQLPGRQDRCAEPLRTEVDALVPMLADEFLEEGDERPFGFFGHSMGALVAFELARELRRRGHEVPRVLGVSAKPAPQLRADRKTLHTLPDDALTRELVALGGMPTEICSSPELLSFVLPTIRADLAVCETYRYRPEPPLPCKIKAFGGRQDPMVTDAELAAWQEQSSMPTDIITHRGGHFYLSDALSPVVDAIVTAL